MITMASSGEPSSARVLLLNAEIPDVQLGWEPHDELPSSLLSWLRQTYPFDEDQRKRLADALVAELRLCAGDEDVERSRDLLLYLAYSQQEQFSATGGEHVLVGEEGWSDAAREAWKERIARLRLHRQLKVANQDGTFQRLKELWCPQEAHLDFLERCMDSIPDFISLVYRHPAIDALFDAAGIHMYLTLEQLEPLFTRWEGEDAPQDIEGRVAFATYLAMCVEDNHALVHALKLRDRAWIPNGEGTQCRPSALYWPNPIVKMVLGEQPALFPDPTLSYTVLTQLQESLSFRQSDEVTLEDVLKQIPSGEPAPRDLLEWLEKSLLQKQLTPQEVREHLLTFPCFLDEDGLLRPARELLRGEAYMLFGRWRGVWPLAAEYPKLAASLKLPTTPKAHDIQTYLHDVAHYIKETDAAALLREEPELFEQLIRCLEALVELDAPPLRGAFPLPCVSQEGARVLVVFPAEGVAIVPPEHDDIDTSDVAYWVSVEGELRAALTAYLERCGVDVLQKEAPVEDVAPETPDVQKLPEKVESSDRGERRRAKRAADKLDTPAPLQHKKAKEKRKRPRPAAQIKPLTKGKESPEPSRKAPRKPDRLPQKPKKTSLPSTKKAQKGQHTQKQQETSEGSWWDRLWDRFRGEDGGSESTSLQDNRADAQSKRKKDDSRPIHAPRREMPSWSSSSSGRRDTSDYTPQRHDSWFRHQSAIQPQLEGARSWIMDHQRTPEFGFAFAPSSLPTPWMYASMMIGDSFERRSQKWRSALSKAEWATSEGEEGRHSVLMRGRIPKGENLLPMPLFGRLLEVEAPEHVRLVEGRHMLPVLIAREDADVRYKVALGQTPVFEPQPITDSFPKGLLLSTVPDRELPLEVHLFLDELVSREQSPVENAYAVRAFIKEHYRYDPSYLEDPEVAQWLRKVTRGQANQHVAALHAGRDAQALGRGVCYELNALACELLRRVGVPAAVSSGWTMDRGQLAQPDHMWAMALLPSDMGLRWLPIDASTTRQGRPLHAARRADGPWRIPPSEAPHSTPAPPAMPSTPASTVSIDRTKAHILGELLNATEHLAAMTRTPKEEDVWRQRWQEILAEPALAEALLQWLLERRSE